MKRKLLFLLVSMLNCILMPCSATTFEVIVEGVKYQCENDEATVIGSSEKLDSVYIKDIVALDNINYTVTSITKLIYPKFIHLPNTIKRIEKDAFGSQLVSLNIPSSVEYIGKDAFWWGVGKLKRIDIDNVAAWCNILFENDGANPFFANYYDLLHDDLYLYVNGEKTTHLIIPNDVKLVKKYAFRGYEFLESIQFPDSLESIQSLAFADCDMLETVIIPSSIEIIESSAFAYCKQLKSVTLGYGVKEIGSYAFNGSKIEVVNCYSVNPPTIYDDTFPSQVEYDGILHVPTGTKSLYTQSSYWSRFSQIIDDLESANNVEVINDIVDSRKIFDINGQFCGNEISKLNGGIYIVKSNNHTVKIKVP